MIRKTLSQLRYIKRPSQLWHLLTAKIKSMELAITYNCNFKCSGCYAANLREPVLLLREQVEEIVNKYKPAHINITGGEPMLHPELLDIIKTIPKNTIVSMVTNGSLLSYKTLNDLKTAGLNTIQLSYGANYPVKNNEQWAFIAKTSGLNVCLSVTNTYKNKPHILRALELAKKGGYQVLWNLPMGELEADFDKETYFKYRNLPYVREENMFWNYSFFERIKHLICYPLYKLLGGKL